MSNKAASLALMWLAAILLVVGAFFKGRYDERQTRALLAPCTYLGTRYVGAIIPVRVHRYQCGEVAHETIIGGPERP